MKFGNLIYMSRLGKQIWEVPAGVEISVADAVLTVKGPKGTLVRSFRPEVVDITISPEGVACTPRGEDVFARSLWGTYSAHIRNMITGVTVGYTKKLVIEGVGFRVALVGDKLEMQLGFSHPVIIPIPEDLAVVVEKNIITITGIDKERVGWFSALIRSKKKPEPYKGKGIRYEGEIIRRKQGKKTV